MNTKSLRNSFWLVSAILISLLFYSCGETGKDGDVNLGMEVDSSKFGQFISADNLSVEFYSPINWLLMQSEVSEKNESLLNKRKAKERFIYKPEFIFFNEETRSFLSVGQVQDSSTNGDRDSVLINYFKMLNAKFEDNEVVVEDLDNNGVKLTKYVIKKPQIVSYKLILQNKKGNLIQFEYTVPNEYFLKEKIAISSSISTIKQIDM